MFIISWLLSGSIHAAEPPTSLSDQHLSRPDPDGIPTEVTVDVYLLQLTDIQTQDQEFSADLIINLSWRDARLAFTAPDGAARYMPLTEVWVPNLTAVNSVAVRTFFPKRVRVEPDGAVSYRQRYHGTLATLFDLKDFPLDSQKLTIEAVAIDYSSGGVQFRIGDIEIDPSVSEGLAGWQFVTWTVEPASRTFNDKITAASLTLQMTVQRDIHYFLWRSILPLVFIAMMASAIFWLDPEDSGPQLGLASATVFSLIAFYLSLGQILPPLEYLTRMDRFVLGVTLIVFLCLAEAVWTSRLTSTGHKAFALRLDYLSRFVHLAALVLLVLFAFVF